MAIPASRDLVLRKNADYKESMVFTSNGSAIDFTGWTFKMMIRMGPLLTDTSVLTVSTVGGPTVEGIYLSDPTNGTIDIWVKSSSLTSLTPNPIYTADQYQQVMYSYYYYDLQATNTITGEKIVYVEGHIQLYDGSTS